MTLIKRIKNRPFLIIMGLWLIIEMIYLIHFNLVNQAAALDQDSSMLIGHMLEMVRNKSLFIPNWFYVSTHEIDSAMLLAIPFYVITRNVWISFAISNIIYIFVLSSVVIWIFNNVKVKIEYALTVCCILLIPYCFGMVEYVNMMFFRGAQYSIKVLIPILGVAILTSPIKKKVYVIVGTIVWLTLVFISGFSSGPLVVVTTILPLVFSYAIIAFRHNRSNISVYFNKFNTFLLINATILSLIGNYIYKWYNNSTAAVSARVIYAEEISNKLHYTLIFFLELINALPPDWQKKPAIISLAGVGYILRFLLVVFILFCTVYFIACFFKRSKIEEDQIEISILIDYLAVIIMSEMLIHLLGDYSAQRYYLIEFVPMVILCIIFFARWTDSFQKVAKYAASTCGVLAIVVTWYTSTNYMTYSLVEYDHYPYCQDLCKLIQGAQVDNAITIDCGEVTSICRVLLPDQKISNYDTKEQDFLGYDWYLDVNDPSYYGDSSIVLSKWFDDLTPLFGEEKASKYECLGEIYGFNVFVSHEVGVPVDLEAQE